MILIGISGKARHGKNYLATELSKILDNSTIYSLSNALKCYCRVTGLMEVKDPKVLQMVGTDLYRARDPHFWTRMLDFQLQEEKPEVAIVPDIRFPDEVQWVENKGGIVIRVRRTNQDGLEFYADDRPSDHPSETALDHYCFKYYLTVMSGNLYRFEQYALSIKETLYENKNS